MELDLDLLRFWAARMEDHSALEAMRTNAEWFAFVSSLARPSTGRTDRITVKCGEHVQDWFLAFAVRDGAVELVRGYKGKAECRGRVEYRLTGPDTLGEGVDSPCLCDVLRRSGIEHVRARHDAAKRRRGSSRISVLSLYRAAALAVIEGRRDTRKGVQLHSLT